MRIGELAKSSGVSKAALRLYEARGLLSSTRLRNGYRDYPASAVERVAHIKIAQELGFSLSEISRHLGRIGAAPDPNERLAALFREQAEVLRGRIEHLSRARTALIERALEACPLRRRRKALAKRS